jgi:ketosteroid isomerase-like protein
MKEAPGGRPYTRVVTSEDVQIATRFRAALETAVSTGDRSALLELVAPDVEWVTPLRTVRGVDELETWRVWGSSGESFDFDFGEGEWVDRGDGRVDCEVHQVYRVKESGDFAYERQRRIELTIEDGRVSRYEVRVVG